MQGPQITEVVLRAVNGLGLALVIPCVQSLIADYHPSDVRGNAFGMMQLTTSLGAWAEAAEDLSSSWQDIHARHVVAPALPYCHQEGWWGCFTRPT